MDLNDMKVLSIVVGLRAKDRGVQEHMLEATVQNALDRVAHVSTLAEADGTSLRKDGSEG